MITYVKGNLLDASETFIMHGCNAQGVMGSGVAKVIREKWPLAYSIYRDRYEKTGLTLGDYVLAVIPPNRPHGNKIIVNAITQQYYGKDGKRYVSYDAIDSITRKFNLDFPGVALAMPLIGAGLAGGDWDVISAIIETNMTDTFPVVYHLEDLPI